MYVEVRFDCLQYSDITWIPGFWTKIPTLNFHFEWEYICGAQLLFVREEGTFVPLGASEGGAEAIGANPN